LRCEVDDLHVTIVIFNCFSRRTSIFIKSLKKLVLV